MNTKKHLTSEEREFFALLKDAAYANPFSDERVALDLKITGFPSDVPYQKRINKVIREAHAKIQGFEKNGGITIHQFHGEDRILVENAFLFDFFHQFIDRFDHLIHEQIRAGTASVKVLFSREALSLLNRRGFGEKDAIRYFALFYQMRRAFFFIYQNLVGRSAGMKELRRNLWNNVFTHHIGMYNDYLWNRMEDFSTLILGETGTGKGTSAIAIGRSGFIPFDEKKECFVESFMQSFISLNLSQFPETLIESELFGHKKGAFTGAVEDHKGVFDRCSPYGSIFLDEIGEVSIPIQIKLLQVLQERIFCPVGSHENRRFQGRVIAATNRSPDDIRGKRVLRDDFFYRLCSDLITVPPLRQRIQEDPGELNDLLAHTVKRILGNPSPEIAEMTRAVIHKQLGENYPWPGNVRELEQCVRRIILKGGYEGDYTAVAPDLRSRIIRGIETGDIDVPNLIRAYCTLLYQRHGTYEEVARRTNLDRRTVKKYIECLGV